MASKAKARAGRMHDGEGDPADSGEFGPPPARKPKPPMFLATGGTVKTGSFKGKSNKLGMGGRAAQLKARGVPGAVIGAIARSKQAAPGQKHYRGK